MKPPAFDYRSPETIEEVTALLDEYRSDARVIAGGQSLIPLMNLRMIGPLVLIDLNRCADLKRIEDRGNELAFGAMVRQREAQRSEVVNQKCPLISRALERAGPVAVRNRATVGGSMAHADRAAELPAVAMALDATFTITSTAGNRQVQAAEFFLGDMTTAIEENEFLTGVSFPCAPVGAVVRFEEVGVRREGVAIVGLASQIVLGSDDAVENARFAVMGVDSTPIRLHEVENLLIGQKLDKEVISQAAQLASEGIDALDDAYASAAYRRVTTGSLMEQFLNDIASPRIG